MTDSDSAQTPSRTPALDLEGEREEGGVEGASFGSQRECTSLSPSLSFSLSYFSIPSLKSSSLLMGVTLKQIIFFLAS